MSKKDTVTKAFMRENTVFADAFNYLIFNGKKVIQPERLQELVQKFGCSKTPIREALVTLCNEGILRSFPRFGYQVVSVSREEAQNILDFRLVLEGGYLRQSIGNITEENLAELAEIDERCKQSTDSVWDHWEANTAFHLKLISFSGNAYAYQELERTMNVLKRAYAQFYWQTWSNVNPALDIAHHNDIMQSIREKDLEKTQNYLKEDLADFCG